MTREQDLAIKALEKAFGRCKSAGLQFCGMDSDINYATNGAVAGTEATGRDDYGPVARAVQNAKYEDETGKIYTHDTYDDSGGW